MEKGLSIKLVEREAPAKALMKIKQLTGLSLSEIKTKIAHDDYLLTLPPYGADNVAFINQMKAELESMGLHVRLFQNGREESAEYFKNIEQTYREIESEDFPD